VEDPGLGNESVLLATTRLRLRPWHISEAAVLRELWTERDPRVPPHRRIDAFGRPTLADIEHQIAANQSDDLQLLAAELQDSGEVIGYCGLIGNQSGSHGQPEIAYELLRRVWGNGYATEAAGAVLSWAQRLGFDSVRATVWDWNAASLSVLAKLGFIETSRKEPDPERGTMLVLTRSLPFDDAKDALG
jgi:[ribosomal protein S5]-alanine N-acetyltransferase